MGRDGLGCAMNDTANAAKSSDGRAGRRRIVRGPTARGRGLGRVTTVPEGDLLPGEIEPLVWQPGRDHPVTEAEALGVVRRRERIAAEKKEQEPQLTESLPDWNAPKAKQILAFPPRLYWLAVALAELEGTNWAAATEELWLERISRAPRDPKIVEQRQQELLDSTVGVERQRLKLAAKQAEMQRLAAEIEELAATLPDGA